MTVLQSGAAAQAPTLTLPRSTGGGDNALLWLIVLVICFASAGAARGAPPVVDYIFPAGGQQGTELTVASAAIQPAPVGVWTDSPGLVFTPEK
ncbi:MAG TPA: hypothetical protein VH370_01040 [Humisphaera sp.]|jgi:hypothetical protein|nr:hypothetical protein [Humisphaera sp.]